MRDTTLGVTPRNDLGTRCSVWMLRSEYPLLRADARRVVRSPGGGWWLLALPTGSSNHKG